MKNIDNTIEEKDNMIYKKWILLFPVFLLTSILVISFILSDGFYFPIDDSYIYTKQAMNLLNGEFFMFSSGEAHTNSNSSVIYYMITSIHLLIAKLFSVELTQNLELLVIISFVFNMCLYAIFIFQLIKLIRRFNFKNHNLVIFTVISTLPVLYTFVSGLETGFTMTMLLLQLNFFLDKKIGKFTLVTVMLSVSRPENILVNFAYVLLLTLRNFKKHEIKVYLSILVVVLSLLIVPLLNYYFTGEYKTASSARVHLNGITKLLFAMANSLSILYTHPGWLPQEFKYLFDIIRFIFSGTVLITMFYVIFKHYKSYTISKILTIIKSDTTEYKIFVLLLVIVSYSFLPLLTSIRFAEYGRYLAPVIPLFLLLLILATSSNRKIMLVIIMLNSFMIPFYFVSHVNITSIMGKTLKPIGLKLAEITTTDTRIALDTAGYMSLFIKGKVIDVYGLGTTRYMKIHGSFEEVYTLLNKDNIDYVVGWESDIPKYYLDIAHYRKAFGKDNVKMVYQSNIITKTKIQPTFPSTMSIYQVLKK